MKSLRSFVRFFVFFYESRIAPLIAIYFFWIYWPVYRVLRAFNVCFVVNIAGGTGHIICELDFFIRRLHSKEIDDRKRYIWIRKNDQFSAPCVKFYGKYFFFAKASYLLYELTLPLTIRFKDITYDGGLSGLQWQLDGNGKYIRPLPGQNYLNLISLSRLIELWSHYYQLRGRTSDFYPLVTHAKMSPALQALLDGQDRKRVLIHIKEGKGNATATSTDPNTYLETIHRLYAEKFQLVFVGREKMPSQFHDFSMINYAGSSVASFDNDLALFQNCEFAITAGSGISFLADCYRVPYLYINSWHLPSPTCSSLCINVPTLLQAKDGSFLTFQKQIELYLEIQDDGKIPRLKEYTARNASADEIAAALGELRQLMKEMVPWTPLQKHARNLGKGMQLFHSGSRFSEYFLKKHQNNLDLAI